MNVLNLPALLFALLAIPIVLLYLLRLRRREQLVSSTLLWRQVVLDREANTLWQRLRRNLLLVLQLLILAILVFALLRPYINMPGGLSGQQIVLLDASASMQATDVAPSRFEAAKAQVRGLIDQLSATDLMTILLVDNAPRALSGATANKAELLNALDAVRPSPYPANWSAAIALAAVTAAGGSPAITVVSDGANPAAGSAESPFDLLDGNVRYIPIGAGGDNLAISTLSLRRTSSGLAALVRVSNTGAQMREALVALRADGALIDARTLQAPPGDTVAWTVGNIDGDSALIQASLEAPAGNQLAIDDVAFAVNAARDGRTALLLSRGNLFLEQALTALPELQVTRTLTPPLEGEAIPAYDLYVLDQLTMTLPAGASALYIGGAAPFTVTGVFSNTGYVSSDAHPILESVNWRDVNVQSAAHLDAPSWLKPVVQSQGGPLLFVGQADPTSAGAPSQGRTAVLPFDLQRSDLPLQIAFPILIANTVDWLAPPQGTAIPTAIKPGEAVSLPPDAEVQLPDGSTAVTGDRDFAQTEVPGFYRAVVRGAPVAFAVNFRNPAESDITPDAQAVKNGAAGAAAAADVLTQREIWPWLAALALVLLLIEWWIYQRGLPFTRSR